MTVEKIYNRFGNPVSLPTTELNLGVFAFENYWACTIWGGFKFPFKTKVLAQKFMQAWENGGRQDFAWCTRAWRVGEGLSPEYKYPGNTCPKCHGSGMVE